MKETSDKKPDVPPPDDLSGGKENLRQEKQLVKLRRIEGQMRGLQKMIDDERDCLEICDQLTAIINSLKRIRVDLVRDHLADVTDALAAEELSPQERQERIEEIRTYLTRFS